MRDRTHRGARIDQALAQIAQRMAAAAGQSAAQRATAEAYEQALSAGKAPRGRVPTAADPMAVAKSRWERERAAAQDRLAAWQAKADAAAAAGKPLPGRRPGPVDQHHLVRRARAAYDKARTAATQAAIDQPATENTDQDGAQGGGPRANLTDPDSRLMKTPTGWVQGYNCQTATSEDQFIIHADATQDTNDIHPVPTHRRGRRPDRSTPRPPHRPH